MNFTESTEWFTRHRYTLLYGGALVHLLKQFLQVLLLCHDVKARLRTLFLPRNSFMTKRTITLQSQVLRRNEGGEMKLSDRMCSLRVAIARRRRQRHWQRERVALPPRQRSEHKPPLISNLHLTFAHFRFLCTSGSQEWTSAAPRST